MHIAAAGQLRYAPTVAHGWAWPSPPVARVSAHLHPPAQTGLLRHWTSACVQPPQYMKTVKVEMGRAYFEHTNPEELVLKEGITQAERPVSEWAQPTAA